MSEKLYLENLAHKVQLYVDAKEQAIKWLVDKQIKNKVKIQNALIMSQIWCAFKINQPITMSDLMIFLGDDSDVTDFEKQIIELDQDLQDLSLAEVLEAAVLND